MTTVTRILCTVLLACGLVSTACTCESPAPERLEVLVGGTAVGWTAAQLGDLPRETLSIGSHEFGGVALVSVLKASGVADGQAVAVVLEGSDGYRQTISNERLWQPGVLLADTDHGKPLDADGPLRIVVENSPGLSVRNLVRLSVQPE